MKQKEFFQTHILPYLDDIINWKVVLFLDEETVLTLRELGLIKEREPTDRLVDDFIVYEEYKIRLRHHFNFISKIQKGDDVLYEYDEETAFKKRPKMVYTADTKSDSASSQIWML